MKKIKRKKSKKTIFSGELMTCLVCDGQDRSSLNSESGWTALQIDDAYHYFCPTCWHIIGQNYGYDNMTMLAFGIASGSHEMKDLARSLL